MGRFMKNIVMCIVAVSIIACAAPQKMPETVQDAPLPETQKTQIEPVKPGFNRYPFIGISPEMASGRVQIYDVMQDGPAGKAGLQRGDVVISMSGRTVTKMVDLIEEANRRKIGDPVDIAVLRNGVPLTFTVTLSHFDIRQDFDAIRKALWSGNKVAMCILVGEVINSRITNDRTLDQWKKAKKSKLIADMEQVYLKSFAQAPNFMVIDRYKLDDVLKELEFNQTGMISDDMRNKLGRTLGATHLLVIEYSLIDMHTYTYRIIEVQTGRVLASVIMTSPL
jgi:membrane-associated protease RseP (regulator of RpoE activity)